jgi:hypothetical protein
MAFRLFRIFSFVSHSRILFGRNYCEFLCLTEQHAKVNIGSSHPIPGIEESRCSIKGYFMQC